MIYGVAMINIYEPGERKRDPSQKPTEIEEFFEREEAWKKAIKRSIIQFLILMVIALPITFWVIINMVPKYLADDYNALKYTYGYMEQAGHNKTEIVEVGYIKVDIDWEKQNKPYGEVTIGEIGKYYIGSGNKNIEIPLKIKINDPIPAGTLKLQFARFAPDKGSIQKYVKYDAHQKYKYIRTSEKIKGEIAEVVNIVPGKRGVKAEIFEKNSSLPLSKPTKFENRDMEAILKISVPEKSELYEKLNSKTKLYRLNTSDPNFMRQLQIVFEPVYTVKDGKISGVQELRE